MRYTVTILFLSTIVWFLRASDASAASTINVPTDAPTIQAGIDAAADGDTVLVAQGVYHERINFHGKAIAVRSEAGRATTIIDGDGIGTIVTFATSEGRTSVLTGFTLRNGYATSGFGGGILVSHAGPTIEENAIIENLACEGGGIASQFGSPLIRRNQVSRNSRGGCSGGGGGAGIYISGAGNVQIFDNEISDNILGGTQGGGMYVRGSGSRTISGNVITGNRVLGSSPCSLGGGMAVEGPAEILIVQNVIAKNVASCGGGIFWSVTGGSHGPVVVNNTIADNDAPSGSAIFAAGYQSQTLLANNIVSAAPGQEAIACGSDAYLNYGDPPMFGNNDVFSDTLRYGGLCSDQTGMNGNIGDAPGFASPLLDDYHPGMGSPAIDKGDNLAPGLPTVDFDGNARIVDGDANGSATVDIGAYEFAAPPVGGTVDLLAGEPGDSQSSLIWVASAVGAIAGIYLPYRYIRRASARGIPRPTGAARP